MTNSTNNLTSQYFDKVYDNIAELNKKNEKLETVIYSGTEGGPSMLLRLDRLEQHNLEHLEVRMDRIERDSASRQFYFRAFVAATITAVVAILIALIKLHLK